MMRVLGRGMNEAIEMQKGMVVISHSFFIYARCINCNVC